jgi:UDP-N-acetylmuramyl pentapeptide synthase
VHSERSVAAARRAGIEHTLVLERPDDVSAALEPILRSKDVVLLKGSRVAGLDLAAAALTAPAPA